MNNNSNESSFYQIGVLAAFLAALALSIGGVALAISGSTTTANVDNLLTMIDQ